MEKKVMSVENMREYLTLLCHRPLWFANSVQTRFNRVSLAKVGVGRKHIIIGIKIP